MTAASSSQKVRFWLWFIVFKVSVVCGLVLVAGLSTIVINILVQPIYNGLRLPEVLVLRCLITQSKVMLQWQKNFYVTSQKSSKNEQPINHPAWQTKRGDAIALFQMKIKKIHNEVLTLPYDSDVPAERLVPCSPEKQQHFQNIVQQKWSAIRG